MTKWIYALAIGAVLAGCGIDGAPVPPGSDQDPKFHDETADPDADSFLE